MLSDLIDSIECGVDVQTALSFLDAAVCGYLRAGLGERHMRQIQHIHAVVKEIADKKASARSGPPANPPLQSLRVGDAAPKPLVGIPGWAVGTSRYEDMRLPQGETGLDFPSLHGVEWNPTLVRCTLLPHQVEGVRWMQSRECMPHPTGGIVADEMGLGKTIMMLALVNTQRSAARSWASQGGGGERVPGTLVVCPPNVLPVWLQQVAENFSVDGAFLSRTYAPKKAKVVVAPPRSRSRVKVSSPVAYTSVSSRPPRTPLKLTGALRIAVIYDNWACKGGTCEREAEMDIIVRNADLVLCTYATTDVMRTTRGQKGWSTRHSSVFAVVARGLEWARIILDEAHIIRNPKTRFARSCLSLPGACRWYVSASPIHTSLLDVRSAIHFYRGEGKFCFSSTTSDASPTRASCNGEEEEEEEAADAVAYDKEGSLEDLVKAEEDMDEITDGKGPLSCVEEILAEEAEYVASGLASGDRTVVSDLLCDLRGSVLRRTVDETVSQALQGVCLRVVKVPFASQEEADQYAEFAQGLELEVHSQNLCASRVAGGRRSPAPDRDSRAKMESVRERSRSRERPAPTLPVPHSRLSRMLRMRMFCALSVVERDRRRVPTKVAYLIGLCKQLPSDTHVVVYSRWLHVIRYACDALAEAGNNCKCYQGEMPITQRQATIQWFNNPSMPDKRRKVLLVSIDAGSEGVSFVGGSHVVFLDPWYNPQVMEQALRRVYRIGQQKPVSVEILLIEGTCEESVYATATARLGATQRLLASLAGCGV